MLYCARYPVCLDFPANGRKPHEISCMSSALQNAKMPVHEVFAQHSGCPAGARERHISYFAMLLHSKKPVYLGFSGKQNCSDTCVPEQFFPRCQNGRAKPPHCLFSQQKTAPGSQIQGGLSRDSERFLRETAPRGYLPAAEYFSTEGIFQLARKVSAIVGSRAPKPSAASAGYRHETA